MPPGAAPTRRRENSPGPSLPAARDRPPFFVNAKSKLRAYGFASARHAPFDFFASYRHIQTLVLCLQLSAAKAKRRSSGAARGGAAAGGRRGGAAGAAAARRRRRTAAAARLEARTALGARSWAGWGVVGEVVRTRHGRLQGRVGTTQLLSWYGGPWAAARCAVGGCRSR